MNTIPMPLDGIVCDNPVFIPVNENGEPLLKFTIMQNQIYRNHRGEKEVVTSFYKVEAYNDMAYDLKDTIKKDEYVKTVVHLKMVVCQDRSGKLTSEIIGILADLEK